MKSNLIKTDPNEIRLLKKQFGQKIASLRQKNNFSQEEVANICDMSIATIKRIESGNTPLKIEILLIFSKVFDIDIIDLFKSCTKNKDNIFIDFY